VIAGVSYGVIENCENRAAVAVENLDASAETGFGGIVGLCDNGTVRNCKNKASFTVAESVVSNASLNTGGIAGKSHGREFVNRFMLERWQHERLCPYFGGLVGIAHRRHRRRSCGSGEWLFDW